MLSLAERDAKEIELIQQEILNILSKIYKQDGSSKSTSKI